MKTHPITSYREQHGMSSAELALKLGVKRAMVDHVENGIRKFSAERAMEIERATGIPRAVIRPDLWAETQPAAA